MYVHVNDTYTQNGLIQGEGNNSRLIAIAFVHLSVSWDGLKAERPGDDRWRANHNITTKLQLVAILTTHMYTYI